MSETARMVLPAVAAIGAALIIATPTMNSGMMCPMCIIGWIVALLIIGRCGTLSPSRMGVSR